MKKTFTLILCIIIISQIWLLACDNKDTPPDTPPDIPPESDAPEHDEFYYTDELLRPDGYYSDWDVLTYYTDPVFSLAFEDTIHVKFLEMKINDDPDKRAECIFEVIEVLGVTPGCDAIPEGSVISVFSEAFPEKLKSYVELYAINYGHTYETGKEYIIHVERMPKSYLHLLRHYFPLEDISKMNYKENFNAKGITDDMTAEQVVAKIKQIIFDYLNDD